MLNLNKAKKWILLANYLDRSHLRNNIAFYLEKMLDEPYSLSGNYVELYVDDYYLGLYFLTEKIEIDKYSINLQDPLGIIVELDNIYGGSKDIHIRTSNNDYIALYDTVNEDLEEPAIKHFVTNFNNLESAVKEQDYSKISSIIDVDSFAKYFLLSEFTINPDAYSSSFFLYKDGEKDKIHAGPGWDFDIGFGNREWNNTEVDYSPFYSPFESTIIKDQIPTENTPVELTDYLKSISTIIYDLLDIPEFSTRVREIYQSTLSGKGDELLNYIRNQADYIRDAVYRDQARWKYDTDFNKEVDYLIDWVTKRYQHFEETYGPESPNPNDNTESVSIESINSINSIENSEF